MASAGRVWRLAALVAGGGLAYLAALFAMGFRIKDLRGV
jgi:putative peptidoglycan lipid II flippase